MSGRVLVAVLLLPAVAIVARICFAEWSDEAFAQVMHISGEMAARLLVASLIATPLLRMKEPAECLVAKNDRRGGH